MPDDTGTRAALKILKSCAEDKSIAFSILDAIKDASSLENDFNNEFLETIAAFAIEGWKNA